MYGMRLWVRIVDIPMATVEHIGPANNRLEAIDQQWCKVVEATPTTYYQQQQHIHILPTTALRSCTAMISNAASVPPVFTQLDLKVNKLSQVFARMLLLALIAATALRAAHSWFREQAQPLQPLPFGKRSSCSSSVSRSTRPIVIGIRVAIGT